MNETIDLKISGASTMPGGEYAGVSISGAGKIKGNLRCARLHCSGAAKILGDVDCTGEIRSTGCLEAGRVHCRAFTSSGSFRISGDLEAETAVLTGAAEIGGLLNAETVEISANRAVHIRAIGGSSIRILRKDASAFFGLFRAGSGCARVGSIEGDEIELEDVEAEIVRGRNVRIGEGCRIGCVEYSGTLTANPGTVDKSVKTSTEL